MTKLFERISYYFSSSAYKEWRNRQERQRTSENMLEKGVSYQEISLAINPERKVDDRQIGNLGYCNH